MPTQHDIQYAGRILREGGLVAFPTETVYGLGANALDADAVAKVFAAKARPSFDPLIVHVADAEAAWALVDLEALPEAQRKFPGALAAAFWPGPLTLVLPRRRAGKQESRRAGNKSGCETAVIETGSDPFLIPGIVTSGLETVGVRVPRHPVAQQLLAAAGGPIAAPSANIFGGISPTRAEHVAVPCDTVLDGGACATGVESTVVGFEGEGVVVLRLGGTSVEMIESVVGQLPGVSGGGAVTVAKPGEKITSPGMLDRHYAPRTPMRLVERLQQVDPAELGGKRVGLLSLHGDTGRGMGFAHIETLSAAGDLTAAAARLFEAMHRLDALGLDLIVAEGVPERGLGRAINDRLRRAAVVGR